MTQPVPAGTRPRAKENENVQVNVSLSQDCEEHVVPGK